MPLHYEQAGLAYSRPFTIATLGTYPMKTKNMNTLKRKTVTLSEEELVLINNALNEILNGPDSIAESEFQTRAGVSIEAAKSLLDRVGRELEVWNVQ